MDTPLPPPFDGVTWPAIVAARAHDPATRVPFRIGGRTVGSVAREHLEALRPWTVWLEVSEQQVALVATERDPALATINAALREDGLILAWRDETFAIVDPASHERLARTERAAARFWGTLTLGAHATGYLAGPDGRPTHLWIAKRSPHKATDPGLYDNMVGGGVADGQTPFETLVREGWEEAGLAAVLMQAARPGRVLRLRRDIAEGLQREDVHGFDLQLPPGLTPHNQDGEVERFELLPVAEALALAAGRAMTVDAALVTLDFALRHGLMAAPPAVAALFLPP
jgi:8-oxo-dGTP pyrophosphatase MutT (NUDIX family)